MRGFLNFLIFLTFLIAGSQALANLRVGIEPAEDRWITLTDGSRVYEGVEISYLLGQRLFDSGQFEPVMLGLAATGGSNVNLAQLDRARESQIPQAWRQWSQVTDAAAGGPQNFTPAVDLVVTPIVESLVYASGKGSDRVVYGFSPEHLNPFNAGRAGALDNGYVASATQNQQCVLPDFFSGQMNPGGWGPFASNFGSDGDAGTVFEILGYGLGFKEKEFTVKSQVRFLIQDVHSGIQRQLTFQITGGGKDIFVAGSYSGFSLGIEIQRTTTLLTALQQLLPQIVDDLMVTGLSTNITTTGTNNIPTSGTAAPVIYSKSVSLNMDRQTQAAAQQQSLTSCFGKTTSWIANTVNGLLYLYGLWRFHNTFDQPLHQSRATRSLASLGKTPKIVILDSGIDYNDSAIGRHVAVGDLTQGTVEGFDFISWDNRPSDDNGHGTAAAKFLSRLTSRDYILIPAKVIGAHGETQSSAIYEGFQYAVSENASAVVVPWSSAPQTLQAYQMGARLAAAAGIPVFVAPNTAASAPDIFTPSVTEGETFQTGGLGATVKLDAAGVAVMKTLAAWLNSNAI